MNAPPTRKPYRITKQREKWTEEEHQRFLDAVAKYGRNWKEIVDHVGTRSVAQVRSHAQKYFLKLEKSGKASVVPPPRPKKRAAKPYPVQDRSEETRRRSKRARHASPNSSGSSGPSSAHPGAKSGNGAITSASPTHRSSQRSAGTAATTHMTNGASTPLSQRPVRATRSMRAAALLGGSKGSSADLEGAAGSNNASVHGSNTERSEEPSAQEQEHSGLSSSDLNYPGEQEMPGATGMHPLQDGLEGDLPLPDYGRLYSVVGAMFQPGGGRLLKNAAAQQQMIEQLEPNQRESLLAMMNQLTGNLRSSCDQPAAAAPQQQQPMQALRSRLRCSPQPLEDGARGSVTGMPSPPPRSGSALPPLPSASQLDPAASMPLMPEDVGQLPMLPPCPANEALRPLPGSQGTALLRSSFSAPAAQAPPAFPSPPQPPAGGMERLQTGATVSSSVMPPSAAVAPAAARAASAFLDPRQATNTQMQRGESDFDQQLFAAMRAGSDLDPSALLLGPSPAKEEPVVAALRTPLDDCLAQLETGGTPSVPEAEDADFLDSWKIGSSDPVWQTLDVNGASSKLAVPASPTRDTSGSLFAF